MKVLLKLLVFLLSLLALVLVVALLVDGSYQAEREKKVITNTQTTFDYLVNLKNQEDYISIFRQDPNIKIWYKGTIGKKGSKMCWSSKKKDIGRGEIEITKLNNNKKIVLEYRQFSGMRETHKLTISLKAIAKKNTLIHFEMSGDVPYPWKLLLLFDDKDKQYETDFEQRLKNIALLLKQDDVVMGIDSY